MLSFKRFFLLNDAISIQNAKDMQLNRKSSGAYTVADSVWDSVADFAKDYFQTNEL